MFNRILRNQLTLWTNICEHVAETLSQKVALKFLFFAPANGDLSSLEGPRGSARTAPRSWTRGRPPRRRAGAARPPQLENDDLLLRRVFWKLHASTTFWKANEDFGVVVVGPHIIVHLWLRGIQIFNSLTNRSRIIYHHYQNPQIRKLDETSQKERTIFWSMLSWINQLFININFDYECGR